MRELPVTDTARDAAVARIEQAVIDDLVEFDEIGDLLDRVWAAGTTRELDEVTMGLPHARPKIEPVGARRIVAVAGDVTVSGGGVPLSLTVTAGAGEVTVDTRGLAIPARGIDVSVTVVFGGVTVLVDRGTPVDVRGFAVIGERDINPGLVPCRGGAVRVRARMLAGDITVKG